MKVLLLCHKMPYPPLDGGAQLINNCIKGLIDNNVDVKVFALNTPRIPVDVNSIPTEFKEKIKLIVADIDTGIHAYNAFINLFRDQSYLIERFYSKTVEDKLKLILQKQSFDIIQLEHLYMCLYLPALQKLSNAKIMLRPQNVEYIVWEQYCKGLTNPFKKLYIELNTKRLKKYENNIIVIFCYLFN